jgi:Flp pilus assembly protein protease CpaA
MTDILHPLLMLWLLVCAINDQRTREVPNLLTIPPFVASVVWAVLQGGYVLFLTIFTLCMVIYLWKTNRMGGADGKVLVTLAATWQIGLFGAGIGMIIWALCHCRKPHPALPGVFGGVFLMGLTNMFMDVFQKFAK